MVWEKNNTHFYEVNHLFIHILMYFLTTQKVTIKKSVN